MTMDETNDTMDDNSMLWRNISNNITGDVQSVIYDRHVMMVWAIVCGIATFIGLGLATLMFLIDEYNKPENKRKRKDKFYELKKEILNKEINAIKRKPILASEFVRVYKSRQRHKKLNVEVKAIVRNQADFYSDIAFLPMNCEKNVSLEVVPFDHTRVVLKDLPKDWPTTSDYINASIVEGYSGNPKTYIATAGPKGLPAVAEFWHMVWQENVHCIVMTTALFENAIQCVTLYWEDFMTQERKCTFGPYHVAVKHRESRMHMTIRTLELHKDGCDETMTVKHFEILGWALGDGVNPSMLLETRRHVRLYMESTSGPMLIHCRDGGTRTAVFIAFDYCIEQLQQERGADVYGAVLHLRSYRTNMIRTLSQYRSIYEAIAMYITSGHSVLPFTQLPAVAQRLAVTDPKTGLTGFQKEFSAIEEMVTPISMGDSVAGHHRRNRSKSRDIMLQPPERARPVLVTGEKHDDLDYINAVFVDGYQYPRSYIVTEWPQRHTVTDLWRLIYDQHVSTIVLLNEHGSSWSFPTFWPKKCGKNQPTVYGAIELSYVNCIKYPYFIVRVFQLAKISKARRFLYKDGMADMLTHLVESMGLKREENEEVRYVKMFELRCWSQRDRVPKMMEPLIFMMGYVEVWQLEYSNKNDPVCIISRDGCNRCGVYCTVDICSQKLYHEGEVDVFNAARLIKTNRPELLSNHVEYTFCYKFLSAIVEILLESSEQDVIADFSVKSSIGSKLQADAQRYEHSRSASCCSDWPSIALEGEVFASADLNSVIQIDKEDSEDEDTSNTAVKKRISFEKPGAKSLESTTSALVKPLVAVNDSANRPHSVTFNKTPVCSPYPASTAEMNNNLKSRKYHLQKPDLKASISLLHSTPAAEEKQREANSAAKPGSSSTIAALYPIKRASPTFHPHKDNVISPIRRESGVTMKLALSPMMEDVAHEMMEMLMLQAPLAEQESTSQLSVMSKQSLNITRPDTGYSLSCTNTDDDIKHKKTDTIFPDIIAPAKSLFPFIDGSDGSPLLSKSHHDTGYDIHEISTSALATDSIHTQSPASKILTSDYDITEPELTTSTLIPS